MAGNLLIPPRLLHLPLVVCAAFGLVVLASGPASAHISVSPEAVPTGSSTELMFRVPNEEASAYTNKIQIKKP